MFLIRLLVLLSGMGVLHLIKGNYEILIIHTNDMHARFDQTNVKSNACKPKDALESKCYGGFGRVSTMVKKIRAENKNVLFLNAGDTYTGTPWFTIYKNKIASEMMNILHPDAASLGNHEFDNKIEGLVPYLKDVNFPILVSNMDLSKEPTMAAHIRSSKIFVLSGHKIGVIGYLTPDTKFLSGANQITYISEVEAINEEAKRLKQQDKVETIIVVGHSGLVVDRKIAQDCPDVDIVVGGHSHTFLYTGTPPDRETPVDDYPVVVTQASGKRVPIVQAYAFTKYLGYFKVTLNDTGSVVSWQGQPILLNASITQDVEVQKALEKYRDAVEAYGSRVIGVSRVVLDGESSCRYKECGTGNLITDAFVYANVINTPITSTSWTDVSVALWQGGGIRSAIDSRAVGGNITRLELDNVLPFGQRLKVVVVPGNVLWDALEHSVHRYSKTIGRGEFMQVSGLKVSYNLSNGCGKRLESVKILCNNCQRPTYQPLKKNSNYNVIMNDFIKDGGDGYSMFKPLRILKELPMGDIEAVENFITKMSPVYPGEEYRIIVRGEPGVTCE
uniref:5'-nucleotidase n=2 Tax=Nyssomyia neivai TaxID=330878 RepID=A0A1L8DPP8_9DIPT